jgi:hypothetical protein
MSRHPAPRPFPSKMRNIADLQSQVKDLHRQLEAAEKEKALLAEKLQEAQERLARRHIDWKNSHFFS